MQLLSRLEVDLCRAVLALELLGHREDVHGQSRSVPDAHDQLVPDEVCPDLKALVVAAQRHEIADQETVRPFSGRVQH